MGEAAISFIGDIIGGITGSTKASKTAAKAATDAAAMNTNLAREIYGQTVARIDPYSQSGLNAQARYNALIGLPSAVPQGEAQQGFQNYLTNFGFQHDLDQGSQAIIGNQASRRLLGSGSTLKALQNYGLGLRNQFAGNYLNLLGNQQAAGLNAATSLSGAGSNYTGQVSANNNAAASAVGNAALSRAASNTNFLGSAITAAAMLSDRRAKTDVKRIGKLDSGVGIYSYRYKGSDAPQVGVMAQEVEKKRPDAMGPRTPEGFRTVNYLQLARAA